MVVALAPRLESDAGLFEEVVLDDASLDLVARVKADLDELAEAAGVVVANGFGVTFLKKDCIDVV